MEKKLFACILAFLTGCSGISSTADAFSVVSVSKEASKHCLEVGYNNAAIITEDHTLLMSGDNNEGQLAQASGAVSEEDFIQVMDDIFQVSIGEDTVAAVNTDHELYIWGKKIEIGENLPDVITQPYKVMDHVKQAGVTFGAMYALTDSGELFAFGRKYNGKTKVMDHVQSFEVTTRISSSLDAIAMITDNHDLYMFGSNIGLEMNPDSSVKEVTEPVKIDSGIIDTAIGDYFTLLLKDDHTVKAIGDYSAEHEEGIFIKPDASVKNLLAQVEDGLGGIEMIESNEHAFLLLDDEGRLSCYGEDTYYMQSYHGVVAQNVKTFSCKYNSILYADEDGNAYAFGENRGVMFGGDYGRYQSAPWQIYAKPAAAETAAEPEETEKPSSSSFILSSNSGGAPIMHESYRCVHDAIEKGYRKITQKAFYMNSNSFKELDYDDFVAHFTYPTSINEFTYNAGTREMRIFSYEGTDANGTVEPSKTGESLTVYGEHNFPISFKVLYKQAYAPDYVYTEEYDSVSNRMRETATVDGEVKFSNVMDSYGHTVISEGYDPGAYEENIKTYENGYKTKHTRNTYYLNKDAGNYELTNTEEANYSVEYSGDYVYVTGTDLYGFYESDMYEQSTRHLLSHTYDDNKTEYYYQDGLLTAAVTFKMNGGSPSYITGVLLYTYEH